MDTTAASPSHPRRGTVAAMRQRYSSSPTAAETPRRKSLMIPKSHHPVPNNLPVPMPSADASLKLSIEATPVTDGTSPISLNITPAPNQSLLATEEMHTISESGLEHKVVVINPVAVYLNVATANIPRSNSWNGPLSPPSRKHRSPRHHLRNVPSPRALNEHADTAASQLISTVPEPMVDHSAESTDSSAMCTESVEQVEVTAVAGLVPVVPPVPRTARLSSAKVRRNRSVPVPRKLPEPLPVVVEASVMDKVVMDPLLPDPIPPAASESKADAIPSVRCSLSVIPRNTSLKHWSRRQQQTKVGKSSAPSVSEATVVTEVPVPAVVNAAETTGGLDSSLGGGPESRSRAASGGVDVVDILASKRAWMLSRSTKPNRGETRSRAMSEPSVMANEAPSEKKSEILPASGTASQKVNPIKAEIDFKAGKRAMLAQQKAKMASHAAHTSEPTPNASTVAPVVAVVTNEKRNAPDFLTVRPYHKVNSIAALEAKTTAGQSESMKATNTDRSSSKSVPPPQKVNLTKAEPDVKAEKRSFLALQIKTSKKSSTLPAKLEKPGRSSSVPSQRPPPLVTERIVPPPKNPTVRRSVDSTSEKDKAIPTTEDHRMISLSWSLSDKRNKAKQLISSRRSWGGTSVASNLQGSLDGTISARPSTDNVICTSSSSFDTTPSLTNEQPSVTATYPFGVSLMNTTKNRSQEENSIHSACAHTISTASISTDISAGPIESCDSIPVGDVPQQELVPSHNLLLPETDVAGIEQTLHSHFSMMDSSIGVHTPSHSTLYDDTGEVVYMSPNGILIPLEDKTSALRANSPVEEDDSKDDDSTIDALVDDICAIRRPDRTQALRSSSPLMEMVGKSQKVDARIQVELLQVEASLDFRPIQDDLSKEVTAIVESSWDTTKVLFNEFERGVEKLSLSHNTSRDPLAITLLNEPSVGSSELSIIDLSLPPSGESSNCKNMDETLDPLGWPVKPEGLVDQPVPTDSCVDEENAGSDEDVENLLPSLKSRSTEEVDDKNALSISAVEYKAPHMAPVLSKEERIQAYESMVPDEESSMECEKDLNSEEGEDQGIDEEIAYIVHDGDDDSVQELSLSIFNATAEDVDDSTHFASFEPSSDFAISAETNEMTSSGSVSNILQIPGDGKSDSVADNVSCLRAERFDVKMTNFADFNSSENVSKPAESMGTTSVPLSLLHEPALDVDSSDKPIQVNLTFVSESVPVPPPPPPPGSKKKKSRRSKDLGASVILPIPPPPEEKLKQWKKSKEKQIKLWDMIKSKSNDSARSFVSYCDSESRAISQNISSSNDDSAGLKDSLDESVQVDVPGDSTDNALLNLGTNGVDDARRDDPVSPSSLAAVSASISQDTGIVPIDEETVPSEAIHPDSTPISLVDEMRRYDAVAQSTSKCEAILPMFSIPLEASLPVTNSKDDVLKSLTQGFDESKMPRTDFEYLDEYVDLTCEDTKCEVEASLSSEGRELIVCAISSENSNLMGCHRSDLDVGMGRIGEPKVDLNCDPDVDLGNDPETIRRLWSTTSSSDPETLRRAFSVLSASSTVAQDVKNGEALDPTDAMMCNNMVQGNGNERVGESEVMQGTSTSFANEESNGNENDRGDNAGDDPLDDSSANRRQICPSNGKCAFDSAIAVDPTILSAILNFLGDPVAVCRTKMLNKICRTYVDENEHTLMRDAVRLGGMSMSVRPSFWLWVVLCKGSTTTSTSLVDAMNNDSTQYQAPLDREFSDLERQGREGKWHHVIERDVSRAFGTLPPHKTGARLRTDSIVRALVSWGRSRLVGRGVKGNREDRVNVQGDESTHSDDVSLSPTDTVSDWGGVTPVGSFNGSFASSQSDPMTHGAEVGTNPSKSSRKKKKKSAKQNLSTEEEYALGANMLTDDMKASLQGKLSFILHALAAANPEVGYCQGMDYLVAHLLRILQDTIRWKAVHGNLPAVVRSSTAIANSLSSNDDALSESYVKIDQSLVVEETIFLVMDSFLTSYGLQHFYWPELRCLKTCCRVFEKIIQMKLPVLADHFEHHELNVGLFALGWFQTLFLYLPSMPSATVCHMWDIWLVERSFKIFFRVGTAILFLSQPILLNHELEGMMGYLNTFPDATLLSPDILIACSLQIKITNRMLMELEQEVKDFPLTC
jgi:Rab-GTPase-TBC domain